MNTCLECLPCLGKNAVDAAKRSTSDTLLQKMILAESFRLFAGNDYRMPPPYTARKILDIALSCTGKTDIYAEEKHRSNVLAEKVIAELTEVPEYRADDFVSRLRLAAAGNILDFGIFPDLDVPLAMKAVKTALALPISEESAELLHRKMESARHIFYLLDNCGEAVFDGVFMESYREKITLGVRGRAAFNDVTADDLADCGLAGWNYVTNGPAGIPGTILSDCPDDFRREFERSDLIIAKGQGNFETMNDYQYPMAFLFLAKCPVVVRAIGAEMNSIQIRLVNLK